MAKGIWIKKKKKKNEIMRSVQRIQEHRRNAFALLGMAHFNYNQLIRSKQMATQYKDDQILGVVKRLLVPEVESSDIAILAHMLVARNRSMAAGLETVIGFELEDLMRKEDADKI